MDEREFEAQPPGLSKGRIETLTDGIFAIAMTLLILGIEVPQIDPLTPMDTLIHSLIPDILQYVVAFLVLAVFWTIHHNQFYYIRVIDYRLLWLNIFWLLLVGGMPFTTSLAETYIHDYQAMIIFGCNIMLIDIILAAHWHYAAKERHLIDPATSSEVIAAGERRERLIFILSLAGTIAAPLSVYASIIFFALIPLTFILNTRLTRFSPRIPSIWKQEQETPDKR
jgi:Predicted integral membrane protein